MYTRMPFSVKYPFRRGRQHNFSVLHGHSTSASAYVSASSVDLPSVSRRGPCQPHPTRRHSNTNLRRFFIEISF
jgi:hypothetical protein